MVADHVIAALTPGHLRVSTSAVPLPMVDLLPAIGDGSLAYAMGRVDSSGAVAATHALDVLGWRQGDRITVRTTQDAIIVRRDVRGLHVVPKNRRIVIPAACRHACGIGAGTAVLLAAAPRHGALIVHPESALDRMLMLYYTTTKLDEPA